MLSLQVPRRCAPTRHHRPDLARGLGQAGGERGVLNPQTLTDPIDYQPPNTKRHGSRR
jgi:hypothetical protein